MARVGVILLSLDGRDMTLDCLQSLADDGYPDRVDVVVDNGSSDAVLEHVAARFPATERIRLERNVGFSAGNNVGIERALARGCDHVLVLNNDTIVCPGAIEAMVSAAAERPGIGAVAPLITYADQPDLVWYAGADFNERSGVAGRMHGYRRRVAEADLSPGPTGRFTGAAVLIPVPVVREVGMLREELFFLFEDVEWSLRIRAAGHPIHFEPSARILHRVARTHGSEASLHSFYYGARNQLLVSRELCPLPPLAEARRLATILGVYLVRTRRADRRLAAARAGLEGLVHGLRGRSGPWPRHVGAG